MSQRLSQYKTGSYGIHRNKNYSKSMYNSKSAANQQMITKRRPAAPLANRGFNPMAVAVNKERKYFDTPGGVYRVNTNGRFILAHVPVLGTDYNNRIGRKTIAKSIYLRGEILLQPCRQLEANPNTERIVNGQQARLIIFIDSQPNGALPLVNDLLIEAEPLGQLNPNNRDRFRILKDKVYVFDPFIYRPNANADPSRNSITCFNRTAYPIKIFKKMNVETVFNMGVAQTIGDINTNALYVFFIGNHLADADLETTAKISMRVRFDDV